MRLSFKIYYLALSEYLFMLLMRLIVVVIFEFKVEVSCDLNKKTHETLTFNSHILKYCIFQSPPLLNTTTFSTWTLSVSQTCFSQAKNYIQTRFACLWKTFSVCIKQFRYYKSRLDAKCWGAKPLLRIKLPKMTTVLK